MLVETIFSKISQIQRSTEKVALCTIVNSKGSSPRKAGAKMLVWENGVIFKTIGGGDLEKKVIENAIGIIETQKSKLFEHKLIHHHGMCCGGTVQIFIEPILNTKKLYIFGAGHTGKALANFAQNLEFDITLIDERVEIVDELNLGSNVKIVEKPHMSAIKGLPFNENTYIVVVTHNHNYDKEIIAFCGKQKFTYLGMIGSHRKVEMAKKGFIVGDILSENEMSKIDWPIGLDINAETPEEIAISILGRIIEVKNK